MSWFTDNGYDSAAPTQDEMRTGAGGFIPTSAGGGVIAPGGYESGGFNGTAGGPVTQVSGTAPTAPTQSAQDFIKAYQQSHTTPNIDQLLAALKAAGYTNVDRYMYGTTPSGNELTIDGQKYKVISEGAGGNNSWYLAGSNDSGGGTTAAGPNGSLADFTTPFNAPAPYSPTPFTAPTVASVQAQPGYQIGLDSGQQAIQNSAASRGTYFTPNTIEGLSKFSTDYAGTQYGNALNQAESLYGLTEGAKKSAYDTNYQNAWQQYMGQFGINQANRLNTFDELFKYSQLGQQAASAGG